MRVEFDTHADTGSRRSTARRAAPEPERLGALNPRYNFDNFIIGNSNRFGCAASMAVG